MRILVCEDEPEVASFLRDALVEVGYYVDTAANGIDALSMLTANKYQAAILDIMLPGQDGLQVLGQARSRDIRTPILLLTAKFQVEDRIAGLDAGANDYLVKPFALGELLARVRVLLRSSVDSGTPIRCAGLVLDPATRRVVLSGRQIFLTSTEFLLLQFLMRNEGTVVTRSQILDYVWDDQGFRESNVVDVYVNYLRAKLTPGLIRTVRGKGYVLAEVHEDQG